MLSHLATVNRSRNASIWSVIFLTVNCDEPMRCTFGPAVYCVATIRPFSVIVAHTRISLCSKASKCLAIPLSFTFISQFGVDTTTRFSCNNLLTPPSHMLVHALATVNRFRNASICSVIVFDSWSRCFVELYVRPPAVCCVAIIGLFLVTLVHTRLSLCL